MSITSARKSKHPRTLQAMAYLREAYRLQGMDERAIECGKEIVTLGKEYGQVDHENTQIHEGG